MELFIACALVKSVRKDAEAFCIKAAKKYAEYMKNWTKTKWSWLYNKKMLTVSGGGHEGDWGPAEYCKRGTLAIGYNLKIERYHNGDNTGLNAVKLICANTDGAESDEVITSTEGRWGEYMNQNAKCPPSYFLTGFSLQMFDYDRVAASYVSFKCQDIERARPEAQLEIPLEYDDHFKPYDSYTSESCPAGTAICGIKTKVQKYQGSDWDGSALNDVRFFCCGVKKIDK